MRMIDCPACGEKVKPGVAVCRHCSAILDDEKAAKHGLGSAKAARGALSAANELPAGKSENSKRSRQ
jgi:hypothetical protein